MTPETDETIIQKNTIDLLKSMKYTFISQEDNVNVRGGKLGEVLSKEFIIKGFTMNDERLKTSNQPFVKDYFDKYKKIQDGKYLLVRFPDAKKLNQYE